jgi:hypothetical protein
LEDNSTRSTTSDQNGSFEFVNLKPGNYALSAQAEGFADFQVPSAELTARQTLRIDVTLGVKSQTETVDVEDTVAMVNTENAVISDSKGTAQIGQLPARTLWATPFPFIAARVIISTSTHLRLRPPARRASEMRASVFWKRPEPSP